MRKLTICFLTAILISCFAFAASAAYADSDGFDKTVETEIVLPSSYLEYFKLNEPIDVWTDGSEFVVAEKERLIFFDGADYREFDLSSSGGESFSVSKVYKLGRFILFLSQSKIYSLNASDGSVADTGIQNATTFAVSGNTLVTNPTDSLVYYTVSVEGESFESEILRTENIKRTVTALSVAPDPNHTVYYIFESELFSTGDNQRPLVSSIQNGRATAADETQVFISSSSGVYRYDVLSNTCSLLFAASLSNPQAHAMRPQGIFYCGGMLYVADEMLNAVSEYDVAAAEFTGRYITAESGAFGRISSDAPCIFSSGTSIFVLDGDCVKIIDSSDGSVSQADTLGFVGAKYVAATNGTMLLAAVDGLILTRLGSGGSSVAVNVDFGGYELRNVAAVAAYEDYYYILNNEIQNGFNRAVVYTLSTVRPTVSLLTSVSGFGSTLNIDLFGDVFIQSTLDRSIYTIYKTDIAGREPTEFTSTDFEHLETFTDYEGNLYSLIDGNAVLKTQPGGNTETYKLQISHNLPADKSAKDFAIAWETNEAYFLFDGFILSASCNQLDVATPGKISVPDGFNISLNPTPEFVTVEYGSKLFEVSLDCAPNFGEYFDYLRPLTQTDETEQFILLFTKDDRYSLIVNSRIAAICRPEDTRKEVIEIAEKNEKAFLVNDCNTYALPIIRDYTKNAEGARNTRATVLKELTFNGTEFSFIECEGFMGYVASSMLKPDVASNQSSTSFTVYKLNKDATVYSDSTMLVEAGSVQKGASVNVLEITDDGKAKILLNGEIYYIDASALKARGSTVVRNVIVVALLFIALAASALYIGRKIFQK